MLRFCLPITLFCKKPKRGNAEGRRLAFYIFDSPSFLQDKRKDHPEGGLFFYVKGLRKGYKIESG